MNAPGAIALLGGREHRTASAAIDRRLLARVGHPGARVAVIPAASTAAGMPATAALARNHWTSLGARATIVMASTALTPRTEQVLGEADIVVLTGGVPGRLVRALGASQVWERVLDVWRGGTALSGSSAGAIALFAWRLALRAPHPLRLVPGLGPLDGYVCVPHFERFVRPLPALHPWVRRTERGMHGAGIVGIDEATALVIADGGHEVVGRGGVTIIDDLGWRTHRRGETVDLACGPAAHPVLRAVRPAAA
jgi:cyanophycinase-like exopeptidase